MMPRVMPNTEQRERPLLGCVIESFLHANLPLFNQIEQLGHNWTLHHVIARDFMQAKIHGDWQYFINTLTDDDMMAIYEAILLVKMAFCESKQPLTFLGDR